MAVPTSTEIASAKGGDTYTLLYADVDIDQTIIFDANNWAEGFVNNTSYTTRLVADDEAGGTWTTALPLEAFFEESKGINFTWLGQGVTVDYNTDGTTWLTVDNRRTVLEDVETAGKFLEIRVTLEDDESYLEQLRLDLLGERVMQPFAGTRTLLFKGTAMDQTYEHQLEFVEDSGAFIENGYIEVQPDTTTESEEINTIEVWARINADTGRFLSTGPDYINVVDGAYTFTGITAYRNGELVTNGDFPRDEWAHWVFVLNTATNERIRLGDSLTGGSNLDMTIGHLAMYSQVMDADDAERLYSFNIGAPAIEIIDSDTIVVSEDDPAVDIYAYSWSVVSSG